MYVAQWFHVKMLDIGAPLKQITRAFIAWCFSSRGRHVFNFISLTDEDIGVQSPDI